MDVGWLKILLNGKFVFLLAEGKFHRVQRFTSDSSMVWKSLSILTAGSFIHDVNIDRIFQKTYKQRKEKSFLFKGIKGQWISNGNIAKIHGCCSFHYIGLKNGITYWQKVNVCGHTKNSMRSWKLSSLITMQSTQNFCFFFFFFQIISSASILFPQFYYHSPLQILLMPSNLPLLTPSLCPQSPGSAKQALITNQCVDFQKCQHSRTQA